MSIEKEHPQLEGSEGEEVFRFGQKGLIVFLAFLNAFVPLSIDLYLPALPRMTVFFNSSEQITNLTLSMFMLFFAISMLFWGPLSDRLGRKKILYTGLALYICGSLICASSINIWQLIGGRIIQASGCGAIQSVSMAIVKDSFKGRIMETVLVWIQTMTVLCPMIAPLLGALLLKFISWRGLFLVLLAGGLSGLIFGLMLKETLKERANTSILRSFTRLGAVLKHRGLRWLLILFAITAMPFMAYLSTSAYIYENVFQTSSQTYSYFFAANAAFSMLGPLVYLRFLRRASRLLFLSTAFACFALSGLLLILTGTAGPFVFALLFMPVTFLGGSIRPLGTTLMMTQLDSDNATVASLMGCSALLCGSIAMFICSGWENPILALGGACLIIGVIALLLWLYMCAKKVFREVS